MHTSGERLDIVAVPRVVVFGDGVVCDGDVIARVVHAARERRPRAGAQHLVVGTKGSESLRHPL